MRLRVLFGVLAIALAAIVVPSKVLENSEAFWAWMRTREVGQPAFVEGTLNQPIKDREIVFVGSSVAVMNILHWQIERDLERPVVEAGTMAWPLCSVAMWLPELEARAPETLVVVHTPRDLAECRERRVPAYDARHAWWVFGPWSALTEERLLIAALGDASVFIRHRYVLRDYWSDKKRARRHPREARPIPNRRVAAQARKRRQDGYDHLIYDEGASARGLQLIIDRMTALGTEVVLVPAPLHPGVGTGNFLVPHIDALETLAEHPQVTLVHPSSMGRYDRASYTDIVHLDTRGQIPFTEAITEALR